MTISVRLVTFKGAPKGAVLSMGFGYTVSHEFKAAPVAGVLLVQLLLLIEAPLSVPSWLGLASSQLEGSRLEVGIPRENSASSLGFRIVFDSRSALTRSRNSLLEKLLPRASKTRT